MTLLSIIKLVKSMSGPEKRLFKLSAGKRGIDREYLSLFAIIDSNTGDPKLIKQEYSKQHTAASLNNTVQYLAKVITASLIELKIEKDVFYKLMHGIMEVRILQERSLEDEGLLYLERIRKLAVSSQQHWIEYFTYRTELNYLADKNFTELSDKALIAKQMKAKDVLKNLNHIQDHHTLFELLKYRLVYSGKISSEDERRRMNDLMLSEMSLVAGKTKSSFDSHKLHLFFQSFFFMDIGDYQSALKTFYSLNNHFEKNLQFIQQPPLDYLSTLNGIMDSLHVLEKTDAIDFYLEKVRMLDKPIYPEYFRYQVRKTVVIFELVTLIQQKSGKILTQYLHDLDMSVVRMYSMINEEKQWEIYLYCSIACFINREFKKANSFILEIMSNHKAQPQMLVCKATRLLNIIIYYETGDNGYLEYEIRSYKRFFRKQHVLLRSEKLLLKYIMVWPDAKRKKMPLAMEKKIAKEIIEISNDKYENQLLKYFNFTGWIAGRLSTHITPSSTPSGSMLP